MTSANYLQVPGITEGAKELATSGPLGLALVVLASAVVWLMLKLLSVQNARLDDAKNNTKDMLSLSERSNQTMNQVTESLEKANEIAERLEKALDRLEKR